MEENKPKTVEDCFATIEQILSRLESPDVSLDESFRLYKAGMEQLQDANALIDQTRKAVMKISSAGNLEPFADAAQ
ncbi:MAG: exodeoxyribonuclease VII small subunit [Bacteroidales bacterium]|nr:exodeoxyribonuclease VII small subunit [Bacteroidales bacterium]